MSNSHSFSDAPQVVFDDDPEHLASQKPPLATTRNGAVKPSAIGTTPRHSRLGDMNARTFWLLLAIVAIVIIGASVGGAVGGVAATRKSTTSAKPASSSPSSHSTSPSVSPTIHSPSSSPSSTTQSAAAATATATTDCPASNGTQYNSLFLDGTSGSVPSGAGSLKFTKFCATNQPIGNSIAEAFVETFDDCIETCAAINFYGGNATCQSVTYLPAGTRPGNCWAHNIRDPALSADEAVDLALMA